MSGAIGGGGSDRREFLRASVAAGGGLLLALGWPAPATAAPLRADGAPPAPFTPNAFVRIGTDGVVTVIVNKAEMGQGVATALPMLLAEELDADWSTVGFEFAPVDPVYGHPGYGIQMTGGSTSVHGMAEPMRKAGAAARQMLVAAAAQQWQVPVTECQTAAGAVVHERSQRRASYGELATAAAAMSVPADPVLKDKKDYRLVGKPMHRLDTAAKLAGTAKFALDVRLPGMLVAVVLHPPVFGAKLKSLDDTAARAVQGVRAIAAIPSGVAVIATGFWAAKTARELLRAEWDLGPGAALTTATMQKEYRALAATPGLVARKDGDAKAAFAQAARTLTADYELPFLAHCTMEPLNCVVDLRDDRCEVWAGSQFQTIDHQNAAAAAGLPPAKVQLHSTFLGGGFGRRANAASDYIVEAVHCAKLAKAPLQLVWTREDDLRAGYYRPMWHSRIAAAIDREGRLTGWTHTIVGQSIIAGTPFEPMMVKDGIDSSSVEGADTMPYADRARPMPGSRRAPPIVTAVQVELHTTKSPVPTLWWRSVGHSHTAFVVESFVDEVAHALQENPLELRRRLLQGSRHHRVLEAAASKAGWDQQPPAGRARGIAVHFSFESYVAAVAEVSCTDGVPRVHKVTLAIDCGRIVNPDTIKAQLEGAVGFGLTATLFSQITLQDGRVEQSNFHDYRMLRIGEMPQVEVVIVDSQEPSTGVGEPGVPVIAPAVCNALFALTGKRVRRLPVRGEDLR